MNKRPKPLARRPLPRRNPQEESPVKQETPKSGFTIMKADGSKIKVDTQVEIEELPTGKSPTVSPTKPSNQGDSKVCRSCGIWHCHICGKCITGPEPHRQHLLSDRHKKKARDRQLLEAAAEWQKDKAEQKEALVNGTAKLNISTDSSRDSEEEPGPSSPKGASANPSSQEAGRTLVTDLSSGKSKILDRSASSSSSQASSPERVVALDQEESRSMTHYAHNCTTSEKPVSVAFADGIVHRTEEELNLEEPSEDVTSECDDFELEESEPPRPMKTFKELLGEKGLASLSSDPVRPVEDTPRDMTKARPEREKPEDLSRFEDGDVLLDFSMEKTAVRKKLQIKVNPTVEKETEEIPVLETEKKEVTNAISSESWERFYRSQEVKTEPLKSMSSQELFRPSLDPPRPVTTSESNPIHTNCSFTGCVFHCDACDMHLTGLNPKLQHELSALHKKIVQNAERLQAEEKCTHPGCAYHCNVCDLHLSGLGPREQHLLSAKHIKKASAKGLSVNTSPASPTQSPASLPVTGDSSAKSCGLSFCYHHCYPCNIHLSGPEPKDQHLQSMKHMQRERVYPTAQRTVRMSSPQYVAAPVGQSPTSVAKPTIECFIDCPEKRDNCYFHCKVCDKHFAGVQPKLQHEKAAKHLKAMDRYVEGAETKTKVQVTDGVVESAGVANVSVDFPNREGLPLVKCSPENDLDDEFRTADKPREYQIEVFHKARDHDAICFMPTGTGKTLVGAMLIDFMLLKNPWRPILFVVDKVLLVLQQTRYLREQIGELEYMRYGKKRRCIVASMCSGKRDFAGYGVDDVDVLVVTAGFMENLLAGKKIRWLDFSMVILDEVHHCEKNHPYKRIIDDFHIQIPYPKRPKLFGLTASPAGEMNLASSLARLRNLLRSTGNARLCQVENCREILEEFKSVTNVEIICVELNDKEKELQALLQFHLLMCYRELVKRTDIGSLGFSVDVRRSRPDDHNKLEFSGDKLVEFRNYLELITARPDERFIVDKILKHTHVVCSALIGLNICGDIAAHFMLKDLLPNDNPEGFKSMAGLGIANDRLVQSVRSNATSLAVDEYVLSAINEGQNMSAYDKLMSIIFQVDWQSRSKGEKPIVLILVDERKMAHFVAELLKTNSCLVKENIKVTSLVGHGLRGDGMTFAKQAGVLGAINDYLFQIVVATSIAEEGLDLPTCDVVIQLSPPNGITSLVQIRGRARQKRSRLYCLCRDISQEVKMKRLLLNEKHMYEAIDIICREEEETI